MLSDQTIIEVVMRKETTYAEYKKMMKQAKSKGWKIQAYQVGFYSNGFKKEI
ncbi:hypothetical protein [Tenacibaculum sp. C7A-26P2]|uniref:hypothetical protein n=1 Tax=Tenacibaculum sp. C7A-26P2 TaxID=3447504 RepID=UPI003F836628